MTHQRRKHSRVDVGLPLSCIFIDRARDTRFSALGHAYDLSLSGMKVNVPVPLPLLYAKDLEYYLDLPHPFTEITGNGIIKWVRRSEDNRSVLMGVEFASLTPEQFTDLRHIIEELEAETPQVDTI